MSNAILRQVLVDPLTIVHYLVINNFRTITTLVGFDDSNLAYIAVQHVRETEREKEKISLW
jgi:hypothetical protein